MASVATPANRADETTSPIGLGDILRAIAMCGGYYLLCEASIAIASQRPPYPVWLAEGFALGFWFITPPRHRILQLLAVLIANLASSYAETVPVWSLLAGSLVNVAQLAGGAWVLEAGRRHYGEKWAGLRRVLVFGIGSVVIVNGCCALLSAIVFHFRNGVAIESAFPTIFISDGLGLMLITPLLIAWADRRTPLLLGASKWRLLEAVVLLVLVAGVSQAIFSLRPDPFGLVPPVFYLGIPFVLWAAVRFDLRGATLALTIYSLFGFYYTIRYLGPFSASYVPTYQAVLQLQGYLAVLASCTLLASALMRERRASQRAADQWRKRYEAAMRASSNVVYEIHADTGHIVWAGDTARAFGIEASHISTTRAWTARIHPEDRSRVSGIRARLASGELAGVDLEYRVRRDDGSWVLIGVSAYGVDPPAPDFDAPESSGRRIVGFVRDITEKKRAEEERERLQAELRQAQKMEAIGQLAGGIAHDFNNILTSILGYGELARSKAPPGSPLERHLDTILRAGERGRVLVSQILAFSRKSATQRAVVDVADIADEVVTLVRGSNPHEVIFENACRDGDAHVLGSATELHQLLMNLATNGLQAMPEGGRLVIRLSRVDESATRTVLQGTVPPGQYVCISVSDQGIGVDARTRERMFEPFYTTKPTGQGTGLGLSLVMSIVRAHGGGIDLVSQPGTGAMFIVWLPHAPDGAQIGTAPTAVLPRGKGERILVVDDEAALRELATELLVDLGYEAVSYENSEEALTAFEMAPKRFDAVISDEVMPGMSGTQLAAKLHAIRPDLPIFIITAYGGAGFELRAQQAGVMQVLKKPYRREDLAQILSATFAKIA
jgi:PAS domain S-box-containing protein